jgi:hypothetical protein
MLACNILDDSKEMESSEAVVDEKQKLHRTACLIEKIMKQRKKHRQEECWHGF